MTSKSSKKNTTRKPTTTTKLSSAGAAPPEVLDRAREMDAAIQEAAGGDGPKAETIMGAGETGEGSRGRPLTRQPGETRGRKTKVQLEEEARAAAVAAANAPPDPMLVALFSKATELLQQYARSQKWTAPLSADMVDGKLVFTEEAWHRQVTEAQIALAKKYGPELMTQYAAEITLGLLILPWAVQNVLAMLKKAREEKKAKADAERTNRQSTGDRNVVTQFPGPVPGGGAGFGDRGNVGLRQDDANAVPHGTGAAPANPS